MKTLIVHTGAIGDFILCCPVLKALSQAGPVTLVGNPQRLNLAVAAGLAHDAFSMDAVDFHTVFTQPSPKLQAFLAGFQRVIVWWTDADKSLTAAIRTCGPQTVQCFPGLPATTWRAHATAYYADCLGIAPQALVQPPLLGALARQRPQHRRLPQHSIVMHPGSGGKHKCWPLERFQALTALLQEAGRAVYWCHGPAEAHIHIPKGVHPLAESDLVQLGHLLASAGVYLGNDSGITHLAAAVGCPTVALFGPTDPAVWGPKGAHVHIVQDDKDWPTLPKVRMILETHIGIET